MKKKRRGQAMVELSDKGTSKEEIYKRAKRVLGIIKEDGETIGRSVETIEDLRDGFKKVYAGDNHKLMRASRMRTPT